MNTMNVKLIVFGVAFFALFFISILYLFLALPSLDNAAASLVVSLPANGDRSEGSIAKTNIEKFTRKHYAVNNLEKSHKGTGAMSAKFVNLYPEKLDFFYEDGRGGTPQGHLDLGQETTTATYEGHVFYFTKFRDKSKEIARFRMHSSQFAYFVEDLDHPAPISLVNGAIAEKEFSADYLERTGIHWRHFYGKDGPRPPPKLYMWPASQIGQTHSVDSWESNWLCDGPAAECRSQESVHIELEVISLAPRAFVVTNFLNDFEVEEIKRLASPMMAVSSVGDNQAGAFESDTRTSENAWLKRSDSKVIDTLFRRAGHVLRVDEKLLFRHSNAEDLQVVHYSHGQKYDPHHDWGVSGYLESRYITLLLYLNDMQDPHAGGETSFPKANNGAGIKVHPGKGNAVLFYNLLEDGNGDDLSLHAALPVVHGEKWLANFWVWDPKFHG